jgi:hypothetical protein
METFQAEKEADELNLELNLAQIPSVALAAVAGHIAAGQTGAAASAGAAEE